MTEQSDPARGSDGHDTFQGLVSAPTFEIRILDGQPIEAGGMIVPVHYHSDTGRALADLHLIANDLTFALQCFSEANKLGIPNSSDVHSKALIFSAVIAYSRPFKSGVRQIRTDVDYFSKARGFSKEIHDYLVNVRDKHVAHSVNEFERATSTGIAVGLPETGWRAAGIGLTLNHSVAIPKKTVAAAIQQISGMLEVVDTHQVSLRAQLFRDFSASFDKDNWQMAPMATFPDSKNAPKRRG